MSRELTTTSAPRAIEPAGEPIGTGRLTPARSIGRMAVLPEGRGRGVGEALLAALRSLADGTAAPATAPTSLL